jgi:hypothetical protein
MAWTLATLRDRVRDKIETGIAVKWSDVQIENACKDAVRDSYPSFFVPILDDTSYTGTNTPIADTIEVNVPASFLASGERRHGRIHLIELRLYQESGTNYSDWFEVRKGVKVDNLSQANPKIRFLDRLTVRYEIRLTGDQPLTPPNFSSDIISGTDTSGVTDYLIARACYHCHRSRQKSSQYDRNNHAQQALLWETEATNIERRHGMRQPYQKLNPYVRR